METRVKTTDLINNCLNFTADFIKLPYQHLWVDYDQEADVLYLSFRRPQRATRTIESEDDDVLVRKDGKTVVGLTILNAKARRLS